MKDIKSWITRRADNIAESEKAFVLETDKFNDTASKEKYKILIVDDDDIHLEMVKGVLSNNYTVYTAQSCKEALSLIYGGLFPQLILLDIIMPEIDGWDTYGRIRAISNLHDAPIAFFTSSNDPKDEQRANELGAVDYFRKPFEPQNLLNRTQKILVERHKK